MLVKASIRLSAEQHVMPCTQLSPQALSRTWLGQGISAWLSAQNSHQISITQPLLLTKTRIRPASDGQASWALTIHFIQRGRFAVPSCWTFLSYPLAAGDYARLGWTHNWLQIGSLY